MGEHNIRKLVLDIIAAVAPDADLSDVKDEVRLRDQLDLDSMDWLNFLVYVLETRGLLPSGGGWAISVERGAGGTWGLTGSFEGAPLAAGSLRTAVKGATFHGLEIRVSEQGLHRARVILDV